MGENESLRQTLQDVIVESKKAHEIAEIAEQARRRLLIVVLAGAVVIGLLLGLNLLTNLKTQDLAEATAECVGASDVRACMEQKLEP